MKPKFALPILFAMMLLPLRAQAQLDERQPGLYTVVNGESIPLTYSSASTLVRTTGVAGLEVANQLYKYKGVTSGVIASDTFVMVVDPKKTVAVKTNKKYDVFVKKMTPDNMLILPLMVNAETQRREYDMGNIISGVQFQKMVRMDFEWERISDNSFQIKVYGIAPGEYGIIFRMAKLGSYDYTSIFGFTIPESKQ